MQRTLQEQIKDDKHPVHMLLGLRSQHLIRFNGALLDGYFTTIAPPTSIVDQNDLLKLLDNFAKGRGILDDDPYTELARNGLKAEDFSSKPTAPWDLFPAAQNLTHIWDLCQDFVRAFIEKYYPTDDAVSKDAALQKWMKASADSKQGNIHGLPTMDNRKALNDVLLSYIYRITAHGVSRLPRTADPWLTFVANFPPCLQRDDLPSQTRRSAHRSFSNIFRISGPSPRSVNSTLSSFLRGLSNRCSRGATSATFIFRRKTASILRRPSIKTASSILRPTSIRRTRPRDTPRPTAKTFASSGSAASNCNRIFAPPGPRALSSVRCGVLERSCSRRNGATNRG